MTIAALQESLLLRQSILDVVAMDRDMFRREWEAELAKPDSSRRSWIACGPGAFGGIDFDGEGSGGVGAACIIPLLSWP